MGDRDEQGRARADRRSVTDPEDLHPPRPRIGVAATLALVFFLSLLLWSLILLTV